MKDKYYLLQVSAEADLKKKTGDQETARFHGTSSIGPLLFLPHTDPQCVGYSTGPNKLY